MMTRPPIVGYFLELQNLHESECWEGRDDPCWRWIEHVAIAYRRKSLFEMEYIWPMGGDWQTLSPFIQCANRKEMMKLKQHLNTEIVRRDEPELWPSWGITTTEPVTNRHG